MVLKRIALTILPILLLPVTGFSQQTLNWDDEYYYRMLQVSGAVDDQTSFQIRPVTPKWDQSLSHPWDHLFRQPESVATLPFDGGVYIYGQQLFQSVNTTLPRGWQDGAIWQGKGYNAAISAGFQANMGLLHLRFRPQIGMAQNREFDLGPYQPPRIPAVGIANEYSYRRFTGRIDYVQRYGSESYQWADLGDSSIELRHAGLRAAFSNRQIWSGPSIFTSLQYGYNAPGFKHLNLGTYRPLDIYIGALEFAYIFGGMRKSDYFDEREDNRLQSVNTLMISFSPGFAQNLSVGAIRTFFNDYPKSFSEYRAQASKLFEAGLKSGLASEENPSGSDASNQVGSVFIRYFIPDYGFEIYAEYGRNDHNADWRDFRAQPNHFRAYSLGMIKTVNLEKNRLLSIGLEITELAAMRSSLTRGSTIPGEGALYGWYTHDKQSQGFTNKGQILGTGMEPSSTSQTIWADFYDPLGRLRLRLSRISQNNSAMDQFFNVVQQVNEEEVERWEVRNIEILFGLELTTFLRYGLEISAAIDQSFLHNHHYLRGNDISNTRFEVTVRKQLRGWLR